MLMDLEGGLISKIEPFSTKTSKIYGVYPEFLKTQSNFFKNNL